MTPKPVILCTCTHWRSSTIAVGVGGMCLLKGHVVTLGVCSACTKYAPPHDTQHDAPADLPRLRTVDGIAITVSVKPRHRRARKSPKPLEWPQILRGDPATSICEACEQFEVRHSGCPNCAKFPRGCDRSHEFKDAVVRRACPLGRLQHLPPHAFHSTTPQQAPQAPQALQGG